MSDTPHRYTAELAGQIEVAWQDRWAERGTYHAPNPAGPWADPEAVAAHPGGHLLVLDMFPYPSGAGLHVGHPLGYIATDVVARFNRMLGKNVLHCLGYDAFGLPAEQYAVQTGQHPRKTTEDNIVIMARQLRRLGLGHDDRRAIQTIDPRVLPLDPVDLPADLQLLVRRGCRAPRRRPRPGPPDRRARRGVPLGRPRRCPPTTAATGTTSATSSAPASSTASAWPTPSEAPVNWCPGLGTVLSNEEVTNDGRSERGNFPVFKRNLRQWMMRITAYADRLADDLDRVDWPEKVRIMQRNWIGRSHGARVTFPIASGAQPDAVGLPAAAGAGIEVFTTRPDTLFGATFMVLAPEHPLVDDLVPAGGWPEGTKAAWTGGAGDAAGGRHGLPAAPPRAGPTSSGRARARTRPGCSPAAGRPTRSPAPASRCSSPTTC